MAVTASPFGQGLLHIAQGDVDWISDTIKFAVLTSGYTPDVDNDEFFDDIDANEAAGTGWSAGGVTLASKTLTYVAADNAVMFDAADISEDPVTFTADKGVVYVAGSTPGVDDFLLGWVDFDGDKSPSDNEFAVTWHEDGILRLTIA